MKTSTSLSVNKATRILSDKFNQIKAKESLVNESLKPLLDITLEEHTSNVTAQYAQPIAAAELNLKMVKADGGLFTGFNEHLRLSNTKGDKQSAINDWHKIRNPNSIEKRLEDKDRENKYVKSDPKYKEFLEYSISVFRFRSEYEIMLARVSNSLANVLIEELTFWQLMKLATDDVKQLFSQLLSLRGYMQISQVIEDCFNKDSLEIYPTPLILAKYIFEDWNNLLRRGEDIEYSEHHYKGLTGRFNFLYRLLDLTSKEFDTVADSEGYSDITISIGEHFKDTIVSWDKEHIEFIYNELEFWSDFYDDVSIDYNNNESITIELFGKQKHNYNSFALNLEEGFYNRFGYRIYISEKIK